MRRRAYAAFIDNQTHPDQTHQNDKSLATTGWCMHVKVEDGEARARTERVPIVLAGADCNGTEGALADCLGKPLGRVGRQCIHDTDVYLVCYAPDRGAHILNCMPGQASNVFYSFFFRYLDRCALSSAVLRRDLPTAAPTRLPTAME